MSDEQTLSGEYSTENFTYDHLESGDFAPFQKLEQSMGEESADSAMGIIGGRYRLEKILGQGGMGKIYQATQLQLQRTVAIKVMLAPDNEEATRRFEKEASVTANLTHPNTVRIFDFGVMADGFLYLVMEHLDGIDLKKHLKTKGVFAPLVAARLVSEVCGALLEAHQMGIVHRDIKPGNIMLINTPEGGIRTKLLDFGLVKSLEGSSNRTRTGIILGSPMYMSPEQVESQPVSPASDLYSLGLTLYTMLTNARPFSETSLTGILSAHLLRYPKPLWEIKPELTHYPGLIWIVNTAFQKKKEDRFRSAAQMKKALDSFIENPRCGFILENGELKVTEKFIYQQDSSQPDLSPSAYRGRYFFGLIGIGLVSLMGIWMLRIRSEESAENWTATVVVPKEEGTTETQLLSPEVIAASPENKEPQQAIEAQKAVITPPAKRVSSGAEKPRSVKQSVETMKEISPEEPQLGVLTIAITAGLDEVMSVEASCGAYRRAIDITDSKPLQFRQVPEASCDLRFELISGSYATENNVPIGAVDCIIDERDARCK